MDLSPVVIGVLALAIIVLHARSLSLHATERERLVQLAVAKDGREYAQLRKASAETPAPAPERAPEPEAQIGLSG